MQAGAILNEPNTQRQDQTSTFQCQPFYFILANRERGLKVHNSELILWNHLVYLWKHPNVSLSPSSQKLKKHHVSSMLHISTYFNNNDTTAATIHLHWVGHHSSFPLHIHPVSFPLMFSNLQVFPEEMWYFSLSATKTFSIHRYNLAKFVFNYKVYGNIFKTPQLPL